MSQDDLNKMLKKKNKKGVSVVIGYVLLIVFAIIISVGVYAWLKTYIPREPLNCPDGVSLFVKEAGFNASTGQLTVMVRNNGRFDVAGYFIYSSNSSEQKTPSLDLSKYLNENSGGTKLGNAVLLSTTGENALSAGDERENTFTIPAEMGELVSIRVVPTRFQEENNRQRFVSCSNAAVQQIVGAPGVCTPSCSGKVCGGDGCGGSCGTCNSGFSCDALGQCISNSCTPAADPTLSGVCGTKVCGTAINGTCGSINCGNNSGLCDTGFSCNATQQCVANCGNGIIDAGEQCDGTNLNGQSCTTQGFTGGTLSCSSTTCQFVNSSCTSPVCGNGVIEGTEACDDGNTNDNDACRNNCALSPATGCSSACIAYSNTPAFNWGYCCSSSCSGATPFTGNTYCGAGNGKCYCLT